MKFVRIFLSQISKSYARNDLQAILQAARGATTLPEKLIWFEELMEWIKLPVQPDVPLKQEHIQSARLKFLSQFLDRYPELKQSVSENIESILFELNPATLLSDAGIEIEHSFSRELFERLLYSVIARSHSQRDLRSLFELIFNSRADLGWFESLVNESNFKILADLMFASNTAREKYAQTFVYSAKCALNTLCIRLLALYISREIQERLPDPDFQSSPFYDLQLAFAQEKDSTFIENKSILIENSITYCLSTINVIYSEVEVSGVSIDLVYRLEAMRSLLLRIRLISEFVCQAEKQSLTNTNVSHLIAEIAEDSVANKSLRDFIGTNVNLIARKIVERTSETGEHYITRNRSEYIDMLKSAAGGGVLTVATTLAKAMIARLGLPLFMEGLLMTFNYSASFVVIQLSHFTLATKTPAMTASTLAARLKYIQNAEDIALFVEDVVCLVRTAFIAVVGNVGLVVPGAILVDFIQYKLSGTHVFSAHESLYNFESHNPLTSMTLLYACLTGFILWLSSIVGGWADNWLVYYRQFDVLEQSPALRKLLGPSTHQKIYEFTKRNFAGIATNVALGSMLAFSGIFGKFFGLPLQVRHVTLSAGSLAFSMAGLPSVHEHALLIAGAVVGIFIIGLCNFSVSFSLSLLVAARARNIRLNQFPGLLSAIFKRFTSSPKDFFLPPKS